jgi:hypothetical protein
MIVYAPSCIVCGHRGALEVEDVDGFHLWINGLDIQLALPDLDDDQRELLLSGTHAQCWVAIHGSEEDDDD